MELGAGLNVFTDMVSFKYQKNPVWYCHLSPSLQMLKLKFGDVR